MSKTAVLVVSFGTTFDETRKKNIEVLEKEIAGAYPHIDIYSAYTSQIIRSRLASREIHVHDVVSAMTEMKANGVETVVVQPTHLLYGVEYEKILSALKSFDSEFSQIIISKPLLASTEDMINVLHVLSDNNPLSEETAIVLMGHGTDHYMNMVYPAMNYIAKAEGIKHLYIGTVEGYPELDQVIQDVKTDGFKKVLLTPLMLVAGDHATNDMSSDEDDSWKTVFESNGFDVMCCIKGLGEYSEIRSIYKRHLDEAFEQVLKL